MRKSGFFTYLLIFMVTILFLLPLLKPGVWHKSHDWGRTLALLEHFKESFLQGNLYPRWLPELYGGYGCPTFLFYPPGFFYLALPFSFLPVHPGLTHQITIVLLFFIGGAGAYKLGSELTDHKGGLFCSILFLLTPYLYVNLFVRAALSELTAMLLTPWPLYYLLRLKNSIENLEKLNSKLWGITISIAFIMFSHPVPAFLLNLVFIIITLFISFEINKSQRKGFFILSGLSFAMGLILSSPYWLTYLQLKEYVNLEAVFQGYLTTKLHTVHFSQFFSRSWEFGGSANGPNDEMSFQLGLPHFLLAVSGAIIGRKSRIVQISFILYITLIFLMTPIATTFWEKAPFFKNFQFPWRSLSITALLQLICAAGIYKLSFRNRFVMSGMVLICMVTTLLWNFNQFSTNPGAKPLNIEEALKAEKAMRSDYFFTHSQADEFLPLRAAKFPPNAPRKNLSLLGVPLPAFSEPLSDNNRYRIHYRIKAPVDTFALINQLYLPGWRVLLNDAEIPPSELEKQLTRDGRMIVQIPIGENHLLNAYYDGPPGWKIRNFVIFTSILFFLSLQFFISKKQTNSAPE